MLQKESQSWIAASDESGGNTLRRISVKHWLKIVGLVAWGMKSCMEFGFKQFDSAVVVSNRFTKR